MGVTVRRWVPAIGMGTLAAAWSMLVRESGPFAAMAPSLDAAEPFALALCCGTLACGVALVLLCAKDAARAQTLRDRSLPVFAACLGMSCCALAVGLAGASGLVGGVGGMLSGALAGFGAALLAALWLDAAGRMEADEFLRTVAGGLVVFAACGGAKLLCRDDGLLIGGCALLCAVSALCLAICPRWDNNRMLGVGQQSAASSLSDRFLSLARSGWWALAVVCVGLFLCGFSWNPLRSGMPGSVRVVAVVQETVGSMCAAALIAAVSRLRAVDCISRLKRVVVPLAVATFVVTPYFAVDAFGEGYYRFVGCVRETALFVFFASLVLVVPVATRVADASHFLTAGLVVVIGQACAVAGMGVARALGEGAAAVPVLLFVAYLVVCVVAVTARDDVAKRARVIEEDVFERYLRERCAELADACHLSPREQDILVQLGRGHGYTYIAESLYLVSTEFYEEGGRYRF